MSQTQNQNSPPDRPPGCSLGCPLGVPGGIPQGNHHEGKTPIRSAYYGVGRRVWQGLQGLQGLVLCFIERVDYRRIALSKACPRQPWAGYPPDTGQITPRYYPDTPGYPRISPRYSQIPLGYLPDSPRISPSPPAYPPIPPE